MAPLIPLKLARNSNLIQLIKGKLLAPGETKLALLPSGNSIGLQYVKTDGVQKALKESAKYGIPIQPKPEEYIVKRIVNKDGHIIKSIHDVVNGETRLRSIYERTFNGHIEYVKCQDGRQGGHAWLEPGDAAWGFSGNIAHPQSASSCVRFNKYKNLDSTAAFKALIDFIREKGSIETYNKIIGA